MNTSVDYVKNIVTNIELIEIDAPKLGAKPDDFDYQNAKLIEQHISYLIPGCETKIQTSSNLLRELTLDQHIEVGIEPTIFSSVELNLDGVPYEFYFTCKTDTPVYIPLLITEDSDKLKVLKLTLGMEKFSVR